MKKKPKSVHLGSGKGQKWVKLVGYLCKILQFLNKIANLPLTKVDQKSRFSPIFPKKKLGIEQKTWGFCPFLAHFPTFDLLLIRLLIHFFGPIFAIMYEEIWAYFCMFFRGFSVLKKWIKSRIKSPGTLVILVFSPSFPQLFL